MYVHTCARAQPPTHVGARGLAIPGGSWQADLTPRWGQLPSSHPGTFGSHQAGRPSTSGLHPVSLHTTCLTLFLRQHALPSSPHLQNHILVADPLTSLVDTNGPVQRDAVDSCTLQARACQPLQRHHSCLWPSLRLVAHCCAARFRSDTPSAARHAARRAPPSFAASQAPRRRCPCPPFLSYLPTTREYDLPVLAIRSTSAPDLAM